MNRPRLLHIINDLSIGGAETVLVRTALALSPDYDQKVICLLERGTLAEKLEDAGVPVIALGLSPSVPNPLTVFSLVRLIRKIQPDLVQTWLYQSDLLGGLAARAAGIRNVIWNLMTSDPMNTGFHPLTHLMVRSCALLSSSIPTRVICCAESAVTAHRTLGYDASRMITIQNGVDTASFRPDPDARVSVRRELGLPLETPLVGMFARLHPLKDHGTLFASAALLRDMQPDAHIVLAGPGMQGDEPKIEKMIAQQGTRGRLIFLGQRSDIPRLTAALDIATLSSVCEGFPNALVEAMACGVPCVATNVGDSAIIIGDTGKVIPPGNPRALATAWSQLLSLPGDARTVLSSRARERANGHFAIGSSIARYRSLYESLTRS